MNRDYSAEHSRRQQSKKRLAWEVDRQQWEALSQDKQEVIKSKIQKIINDYFKPSE